MHVHPNQVNPNAQLDAMYAAQKAAAKREAERTRKKLFEFASELAAEMDEEACVVQLGSAQGEHREDAPKKRQNRARKENAASGTESFISDWA